ncbi:MAG: hypothetical protein P8X85_20520 [Desulfobacterales bacterium]
MRHFLLLLIVLGLALSCSGLPRVYPAAGSADPQPDRVCRSPFPRGDWQLLHSIEATLPVGKKGFLMGLTVISSSDRTARVVIMTLEGFVLFDAFYDGQISVERAIAPFDSKVFANGLIEDIKLIFFKPTGSITTSGLLKSGAAVCRYHRPDGSLEDIIARGESNWEIKQYRADFRLARTVKMMISREPVLSERKGIAEKIELNAHGSPGYTLVMDLVEAVPLDK